MTSEQCWSNHERTVRQNSSSVAVLTALVYASNSGVTDADDAVTSCSADALPLRLKGTPMKMTPNCEKGVKGKKKKK